MSWETEFAAGRAAAEARIHELMRPGASISPGVETPGPAAGSPEAVARSIAGQVATRPDPRLPAQRLAEGVRLAVTDLPGQTPSDTERRQWAVQVAIERGAGTIRPGEARPFGYVVIRPENAAEVDRLWTSWQQDALLHKTYTDRELRKLGIGFGMDEDGDV